MGLVEFGYRLGEIRDLYQRGWVEMTRALLLPLIPAAAWFGLLVAGAMWAPASLLLAIFICMEISNASIIPNAIMHYAICPLIEAIRDELYQDEPRYNGLVHIRDLPPAPAAAPAAAAQV